MYLYHPMRQLLYTFRSLLPAFLIGIFPLFFNASCKNSADDGEVVVDTMDTDFFEQLNAANAVKVYEGLLACPDCPGIVTTLRIHEDSLSYRLKKEFLASKGKNRIEEQTGGFTRETIDGGTKSVLKLLASTPSDTMSFEAKGDTLLILLNSGARSVADGKFNSLKRR